jgi:hypothetical protein
VRNNKELGKLLRQAKLQSDHLSHQVHLLQSLYAFTSCEGLEKEIEKAQTKAGKVETALFKARRALGGAQ